MAYLPPPTLAVTKVLSSATVKSLKGTPLLILPAAPAGMFYFLINCTWTLHYGGNNAFVANSATVQFFWDNPETGVANLNNVTTSIFTATANSLIYQALNAPAISTPQTAFVAKALYLANSASVEISGNASADNTITIDLLYSLKTY